MKRCIYARCGCELPDEAVYCLKCGRKQIHERQTKRRHRRENGSGTIYKMPGKRSKPYVAKINGVSTGQMYATYQEAEAALQQMEALSQRNRDLYNITLEDAYTRWSDVAYRDMGQSSRRGYELAWKQVPPDVRGLRAREVRADDFQAIVDGMQAKGLSDSSANKVKFLYGKLCAWMMERDLIGQNYAQFVHVQSTPHRPVSVFSPDEIQKIEGLAKGDPSQRRTQCAMLTMIYLFTGFRISELFALKVERVHLDPPSPYMVGGLKTQAGRDRVVPIYKRILPYVVFFVNHATGELLISGYCGRKSSDGWRANDYKAMLAYLGIPYKVPHNTRKTLATNAASAGVDPIALQKLFGWTDINVGTAYYIDPDVLYLAKELDKLDNLTEDQ